MDKGTIPQINPSGQTQESSPKIQTLKTKSTSRGQLLDLHGDTQSKSLTSGTQTVECSDLLFPVILLINKSVGWRQQVFKAAAANT